MLCFVNHFTNVLLPDHIHCISLFMWPTNCALGFIFPSMVLEPGTQIKSDAVDSVLTFWSTDIFVMTKFAFILLSAKSVLSAE